MKPTITNYYRSILTSITRLNRRLANAACSGYGHFSVVAFGLMILGAGCLSHEAQMAGEVSLHKAVPQNPLIERDRSEQIFMLRDRGFNASEVAGALNGPFGNADFVGFEGLKSFAGHLRNAAKQNKLQMELNDETQNPAVVRNFDRVITNNGNIYPCLQTRMGKTNNNEETILEIAK